MSWDFEKTLGTATESLSDIFKMKYAYEYGEKSQPLVISTVQQAVIPLVLIGCVFLLFMFKGK